MRSEHRRAPGDARRPTPIGLTVDQVQSTGRRQDAREPVPVTAWVPHRVVYDEAQLIDAEAIAWTEAAVLIRWTGTHHSPQPRLGLGRPESRLPRLGRCGWWPFVGGSEDGSAGGATRGLAVSRPSLWSKKVIDISEIPAAV